MSIISFTCDKNYIYVLIYYIFELGRSILENFENKNKRDINNIIFNIDSQYIQIILFIFADLLFFPFVIYTKCAADTQLINNNPVSSKLKKIISYIILISIVDLLSRSVYFLFFIFIYIKGEDIIENLPKRYNMDYLFTLDILFRYLFSRIILKTKIYKHHKVSIIICILGFILLVSIDFFCIDYNINNIIFILIVLLRPILFPLEDTINQILLSKYFLLPHYLMTYRGIIEFLALSFISIILIILKIELFKVNILSFYNLVYLIFYSVKAFCLMKIIYIFNSQYVSFLVISESLGSIIVLLIKEKQNFSIIFEIISITLIIFGALIYNEIIIINLYGLETKTKKNLTLEEKEEIDEQMIALSLNVNNLDKDD